MEAAFGPTTLHKLLAGARSRKRAGRQRAVLVSRKPMLRPCQLHAVIGCGRRVISEWAFRTLPYASKAGARCRVVVLNRPLPGMGAGPPGHEQRDRQGDRAREEASRPGRRSPGNGG